MQSAAMQMIDTKISSMMEAKDSYFYVNFEDYVMSLKKYSCDITGIGGVRTAKRRQAYVVGEIDIVLSNSPDKGTEIKQVQYGAVWMLKFDTPRKLVDALRYVQDKLDKGAEMHPQQYERDCLNVAAWAYVKPITAKDFQDGKGFDWSEGPPPGTPSTHYLFINTDQDVRE
eukprot:TRINITY_DN18505_c0_g2_i1.p2 TRINITY_DN18505_c0_g2~~TRINITY_DN18505_c0_g2_i1.p2  ORF type:complete len:171 (-),score=24.37 TRINITY_DN18505_c0_g2_i1:66-578(-)